MALSSTEILDNLHDNLDFKGCGVYISDQMTAIDTSLCSLARCASISSLFFSFWNGIIKTSQKIIQSPKKLFNLNASYYN